MSKPRSETVYFHNIARITALLAAAMAPQVAQAQPGSRICGWITPTPDGEVGIVYEARQADTSYSKWCDDAINSANGAIAKDAYLKTLPWVKERKATCESVGTYFQSSNSPQDMCDKTHANCMYQVVFNRATNTTTYKNLGCNTTGSIFFDFLKDIGSTLDSAINTTTSVVNSVTAATEQAAITGYNQASSEVQTILQDLESLLFPPAAAYFAGNNQSFLVKLSQNMNALDGNGKAAVNRLTAAMAAGQLDDNVRADMQLLAGKLGLVAGAANSIVPSNVARSSWGIYGGVDAAFVAGVQTSVAIVMNTFSSGGTYPIALTVSDGGELGLDAGASAQLGIFWQPGDISQAQGGYIGLGVEVDGVVGGAAGVTWSLSPHMDPMQVIPGFSVAFATGVEVKAGSLQGGYTVVEATFN